MGIEKEGSNKTNFIYVGERSFWRYKTSGWGMIIPRIDSERLKISKNSVARIFISYDERLILVKVMDTHTTERKKIEEEVLQIIQQNKARKEDIEKLITQLQEFIARENTQKKKSKEKAEKQKQKEIKIGF